ncbi:MAG: 1-(5-phosphoribosyl)-5-[(5-phosphoribosylamino)methylideneamino]imidazole-4-carboxamide isomerase [Bacteroidales bacterium]
MINIIPAIDIIEGKCVRLSQGDYSQKKIYNDDPVEVAKEFEDYGFKRLHVVDLDGAKAKHVVNIRILEKIASKTDLLVDFGGGIKTDEDLQQVFDAGAHQATIGSIAVQNKGLFVQWLEEYGAEKFILAADFIDDKIAIGGWQNVTDISLDDFIAEYESKGVQYVLCTDISKDGMLQGSSVEIYRRLHHDYPQLNIIASGGITFLHEIEELDRSGIYGVIIGKAIYEGRINLDDLAKFISE